MERTFSVDDIMGNIFRLGQGSMGRTDSEAAFQEFLKRIPSATNLAAATVANQGGMDPHQQVQHFQQQLQGLHQQQQQQQQQVAQSQSTPGGSSGTPAGSTSPSTSSAEALVANAAAAAASNALQLADGQSAMGNIPRVASLDLLRRLVVSQGLGSLTQPLKQDPPVQQAPVAPPPPAQPSVPDLALLTSSLGLSLTPADLASIGASGLTAALQAVPGLSAGNPLAAAAAAAAAQLNPAAAAAAAALQINQLGQLRLGGAQVDKDTIEKAEIRRARRMLSNRESARRSRRRKQEHLGTLEKQIDALEDERKATADRLATLERRCHSAEEENKRLKEENERLREELRFLRNEFLLPQLADRNGYYRRERQHEDHDDAPSNKRMRAQELDYRNMSNGNRSPERRIDHDSKN